MFDEKARGWWEQNEDTRLAYKQGHEAGSGETEARVLADVADALAERIPTIRGLMQKVGNDAPLHAFVEALRSGSGSWRGETTDDE